MAKANPIQIQKYLKGMSYPASKDDVVSHAKEHQADKDSMNVLNQLPEKEYESAADVSKAIGQVD